MVTQISNGLLTARIDHKGAELVSVFNQANRLEYMWNADPKFWAKTSPVLFPVVGALKNGSYKHNGRDFKLSRHGFARDKEFELGKKEASMVEFLLKSSEDTLKVFPFDFEFRIIYSLEQFTLNVIYEVKNLSEDNMYFSLGAHPAFKVPLVDGTTFEDYYLKFETPESSSRWPITSDGILRNNSIPVLREEDKLPLKKVMFYDDALVLKNLKSSMISIRSHKHTHGVDMTFDGFPYFGIWSFRDADFVCLEPWCGVADNVDHNGELASKEGIHILARGGNWARTWSVKCY